MKKILIFMSILGLFMLASCEDKNPNSETSNSNPSVTNTSTQSETSESLDNDDSKKDGDTYDDDLPWGPLH